MKECQPQSPAVGANVGRFLRFPWSLLWVAVAVAVITAIALGHWSAVASWLPFALVLLCPLMHLLHGGRGRSVASGQANDAVDG